MNGLSTDERCIIVNIKRHGELNLSREDERETKQNFTYKGEDR